MDFKLKIGKKQIFRVYVSKGHDVWCSDTKKKRPSWMLHLQLGPGAGYRWIDLPGYQNSIHAPWYRSLSISGRTLSIGRYVRGQTVQHGRRQGFGIRQNKYNPANLSWFVTLGFTRNANVSVYPHW